MDKWFKFRYLIRLTNNFTTTLTR